MTRKKATFIDGWWWSCEGAACPVLNAATGKTLTVIDAAKPAQADLAVKAAKRALPVWSATPPAERGRILEKIADGLAARADEIAAAITAEVGMPLRLSQRIQVGAPIEAWRHYAALASAPRPERRIGHSVIVEEPVGVVAAITPWNYPLHQITAKAAAALAAGCTVVLKPSEIAPLSAIILAEVIAETDLPPGAFNMVTGLGAELGPLLVSHPDVAMISFTGSTQTGRQVAAGAVQHLKRVALELGGKSPAVILEGADLGAAVKATLSSCLLNSGQTCNALTRLIVPVERLDEAAGLLRAALQKYPVGDPADPSARLGPLASEAQKLRVTRFVDNAVSQGAPIIAQARIDADLRDGFFVAPVILGPLDQGDALVQQEIFGPVLVVQTHRGTQDAIRLANCTRYGLAASVWAGDRDVAVEAARQIRAGQIDINGAPFNPLAPFGGFGSSGLGRENGEFGLAAFLETKSLQFAPET